MNRETKLPLAGITWMIAMLAVLIFGFGYRVEAQDSDQQLEVQPSEGDEQINGNDSNQNNQDQEKAEQEDAQEGNNQPEDNNNQEQDTQNNQDQGTYDYVAQPGDSYTLMARKAAQTYGLVNDINLTTAEIVYAETHLTKQAGEPKLEVGQEVQFQVSEVAKTVKEAQGLSEEVESMWSFYAQQVPSFNTNNVGEGSVRSSSTEATDDGGNERAATQDEEDGDSKDASSSGNVEAASDQAGK